MAQYLNGQKEVRCQMAQYLNAIEIPDNRTLLFFCMNCLGILMVSLVYWTKHIDQPL